MWHGNALAMYYIDVHVPLTSKIAVSVRSKFEAQVELTTCMRSINIHHESWTSWTEGGEGFHGRAYFSRAQGGNNLRQVFDVHKRSFREDGVTAVSVGCVWYVWPGLAVARLGVVFSLLERLSGNVDVRTYKVLVV